MKVVKILGIALGVYALLVAGFEIWVGTSQPEGTGTVVITTFEQDGTAHDRVLSALESGGEFYVSVNHWPRAWYWRLLDNPNVQITEGGETRDYIAVPVSGEEQSRVERDHAHPFMVRVLVGFAPRRIVRLVPVQA